MTTLPGDRLRRILTGGALIAVVGYHLALLLEQVLHPEPFLNDSVLHFGLIQALASAPERGQSWLDPWIPTWTLGFPPFHYYQNLPHLLVVGLWKLTFEAIPLVQAFKFVEWLAVGTLPVSVFLAMRKLGFDRLSSLLAGTLSLWIRTDYLHGLDFESYVWIGLGQYAQAVGAWFFPLGLAWTFAALRDGKGYGAAVLLMTATFLAHLALGYMAFMAAGLFAVLSRSAVGPRVIRLAVVAGVTVIACSYVVIPIFRDFAFYNVSTLVPSWKYNSRGAEVVVPWLVKGDLFDHGRLPVLTVLVLGGLGLAGWRAWKSEPHRFLLVSFLFFLALYFGRPTWGSVLDFIPLGKGFHYSRAVFCVHLFGVMMGGIVLAELVERLRRVPRAGAALGAALVALLLAPVAKERTEYLLLNADNVRRSAAQWEAERDDLEAALAVAAEDRNGRVYAGQGGIGGHGWGGNFVVGGAPVYSWFPREGMDALGYLYHMWSLNADFHDTFDERRPVAYRVFNVRRIIAPVGQRTPPFAKEIFERGRFRVLEVEGPGFLELVESPYWFNVPKKNVGRLHRLWLKSDLPGAGVHPYVRLLEEGRPVDYGHSATGYDIVFPDYQPFEGTLGEVVDVRREGEDFHATVRVDHPSNLMLKMSFHPGWRVTVDGEDAPALHLLPSYVGVALPVGTHEVTFRYDPGPLKGVLLALGLVVLAGFTAIARRMPF